MTFDLSYDLLTDDDRVELGKVVYKHKEVFACVPEEWARAKDFEVELQLKDPNAKPFSERIGRYSPP